MNVLRARSVCNQNRSKTAKNACKPTPSHLKTAKEM